MPVFQAVTMAAQRKCAVISVGCKRWVFYWGEAPRGRSVKCVCVCVTVSIRSVTSARRKPCSHCCVCARGELTSVSFHLVSGINVHDGPSLLLLTSAVCSLRVLIRDQQDSSAERRREEQPHTETAGQKRFCWDICALH